MKIITKCIINMNTLDTISEDSYEYNGPVAECKGGSSGGGGSSSGKVSYPAYVEQIHGDWLNGNGGIASTADIATAINAAYGNSPYAAAVAYDPDDAIAAWELSVNGFATILTGIDEETDWARFYGKVTDVTSDTLIDAVNAFSDDLDDNINIKVLPKFRRGMQDINAVPSSAFALGEAVIWAFRDRDVAKYSAGLRIETGIRGTEQIATMMSHRIGWEESYVKTIADTNRIKIIAKNEEGQANVDYDHKDAVWDMEIFQHAANLLAGPHGGTLTPGQPSKTSTALGGAMTGAAAGFMIGGPAGAAVGGLLGAASSFL